MKEFYQDIQDGKYTITEMKDFINNNVYGVNHKTGKKVKVSTYKMNKSQLQRFILDIIKKSYQIY